MCVNYFVTFLLLKKNRVNIIFWQFFLQKVEKLFSCTKRLQKKKKKSSHPGKQFCQTGNRVSLL